VVSPSTPPIDPRFSERRSAVRRLNNRRRLRIALAVVGCAAVVGGTIGILHSPVTRVRHVIVQGGSHTSRQAVLRAAGLDRRPLMIDVDTGGLERRLEALPWVGRATVARHWPSTLSISLHERVPAALADTTGGDWALIDATGHVLLRSAGAQAPPPRLRPPVPTLRGLEQLPATGSALPASTSSALRVLAALQPPLSSQVRSVDVLPNGEVALTLGTGVVVQLGDASHLRQELAATQAVLSQVGAPSVRNIDVRVPEAPAVTRR
jgi:cell division protein FtsQ